MVLSERSGQQEDDEGGQEQYAFYYRTSETNLILRGYTTIRNWMNLT